MHDQGERAESKWPDGAEASAVLACGARTRYLRWSRGPKIPGALGAAAAKAPHKMER
jgi:hypothetical protein